MDITDELATQLLNAAPDPTVIVDQQGTIIYANARVSEVLGYNNQELVGEAIGDRLLELRDGMPVTRWRAWLREESLLPRSLVERYLHAAEKRRERRVERELLARIALD